MGQYNRKWHLDSLWKIDWGELSNSLFNDWPVVFGHSLASNSYRISRSTLIDRAWILNMWPLPCEDNRQPDCNYDKGWGILAILVARNPISSHQFPRVKKGSYHSHHHNHYCRTCLANMLLQCCEQWTFSALKSSFYIHSSFRLHYTHKKNNNNKQNKAHIPPDQASWTQLFCPVFRVLWEQDQVCLVYEGQHDRYSENTIIL